MSANGRTKNDFAPILRIKQAREEARLLTLR